MEKNKTNPTEIPQGELLLLKLTFTAQRPIYRL